MPTISPAPEPEDKRARLSGPYTIGQDIFGRLGVAAASLDLEGVKAYIAALRQAALGDGRAA